MLTSLLLHTSCDVHVYVRIRELSACRSADVWYAYTFLSCDVSLYPCAGYTASSPKGSRNKCLGRRGLFPARNHGSYAILRWPCIISRYRYDRQPVHRWFLFLQTLKGKRLLHARKSFTNPSPLEITGTNYLHRLFSAGFSNFNSGTILYDLRALRTDCSFQTYMDLAESLTTGYNFRIRIC